MKPLFEANADWTFPLLEKTWEQIEIVAKEELEMDYYPAQIEICTYEQMVDAYTSIGMPIYYQHWSFGKSFVNVMEGYQRGQSSLALELIINSNPSIAYCMEDNDMMEQALVMAHASVGHSHFFKNNYLFRQWTEPEAIVDYLDFARKYIAMCEERYGLAEVEKVIDSCHALENLGVDKYKRKHKKKLSEEARELEAKLKFEEELNNYDDVFKKTVPTAVKDEEDEEGFAAQENLLYFIEKRAPNLPEWKREIIRIVRKIAQYFFAQAQDKVANEGCASFVHHYIMTSMMEKGLITDGSYQSFLKSHSNVVYQPVYTDRWYSGYNPYALGFKIFKDIERMCKDPTAEDKEWFPEIAGSRWQDTIKYAIANFNDESFIMQYLSPRVIRDLKLFQVSVDTTQRDKDKIAIVTDIHDVEGYKNIRKDLSESHSRIQYVPDIQVVDAKLLGNRTLTLEYFPYKNRPLSKATMHKTLAHVRNLWGYDVELIQDAGDGNIHLLAKV